MELGFNKSERLKQYKSNIDALAIKTINVIRNVSNKGLVLGNEGFLQKIEKQIKRKIQFFTRGGDRKSEWFRNQLL
ncbi:MAG: hypothetical protein HFP77_04510 [Methylococcales symbiont of Iophon sp. n. MRB-2018]|nr:MAG: hypothetical protein HFP77_04510 [Methylococcales symbiont of Iophon sp. n. MRB-2018]KAF3980034.1 MAG: hypothetical protein HFP76_04170 [Methylococcales symbiont of Iophon sp. n. MRB-2018]